MKKKIQKKLFHREKKKLLHLKKNILEELPPQEKNHQILKIILFVLSLISFGVLFFSLISQISLLDLEVKNLTDVAHSLQKNQYNLKEQLALKDQQVDLLKNTIKDLQESSKQLTLKESRNFENLKTELAKNINNKEKLTKLGVTVGLVVGFCFVCKIVKSFFN